MKKLPVLTFAVIALSAAHSYAQQSRPMAQATRTEKNESGAPTVTIGTIEGTMTSRERVLAYPRLLAQQLNCEVTGFLFSITANGKTWGPFEVKGAAFPEEVRDKIKEAEAPPKVTITIDKIKVKCNGGAEETARPITVEYDH